MNARITVVRKTLHIDIIRQHFPEAAETATACPDLTEGQVFEVRGGHIACPEGFCDDAWTTMEGLATRACNGEKLLWESAFPCCAAGLRPVTFHIESIDDASR